LNGQEGEGREDYFLGRGTSWAVPVVPWVGTFSAVETEQAITTLGVELELCTTTDLIGITLKKEREGREKKRKEKEAETEELVDISRSLLRVSAEVNTTQS